MLLSQTIQRRQSEIRQQLAHVAAIEQPNDEQRSQLAALDTEYQTNESRFRAALISEDTERRAADAEMGGEKRDEWSSLVQKYEVRQVIQHFDEGAALNGATAEVVQELRSAGGFRGIPLPLEALEQRAGETIAASIVNPVSYQSIIQRLFPQSVAARMGGHMVNIGRGAQEYPLTSSAVTAAWAATETADAGTQQQFTTSSKTLKPHHNLGIQLLFTRRALLASAGVEDAARNDIRMAIQAELDRAIFNGSGTNGQPLGVIAGQSTYGYATSDASGADYAAFRNAIAAFMLANAASGPGDVRILTRPEVWDILDDKPWDTGSGVSEWDRLVSRAGPIVLNANAMPTAGATSSRTTSALLTTTSGSLNPFFIGIWGALDMIRDPYSNAAAGGVRLSAVMTCDVTVPRASQLHLLKDLPIPTA